MERFVFETFQLDRGSFFETAVRPHEVVVGYEERGECNGSVEVLEPSSWPGVELVGSVEPFDELFVLAIGFAFRIEVFQTDDGVLIENAEVAVFDGFGVVGGNGTIVGGQSVGDEFSALADGIIRRVVAAINQPKRGFGAPSFG